MIKTDFQAYDSYVESRVVRDVESCRWRHCIEMIRLPVDSSISGTAGPPTVHHCHECYLYFVFWNDLNREWEIFLFWNDRTRTHLWLDALSLVWYILRRLIQWWICSGFFRFAGLRDLFFLGDRKKECVSVFNWELVNTMTLLIYITDETEVLQLRTVESFSITVVQWEWTGWKSVLPKVHCEQVSVSVKSILDIFTPAPLLSNAP